jgi:hypothetical protein
LFYQSLNFRFKRVLFFSGNKQTRLNQAHRAADARAELSRLAHCKKIGIK